MIGFHFGTGAVVADLRRQLNEARATIVRLRADLKEERGGRAQAARDWLGEQQRANRYAAEIEQLRAEVTLQRIHVERFRREREQAEVRLAKVVEVLDALVFKGHLDPESYAAKTLRYALAAAQPEVWSCARCGYQNSGPICTHCAEPRVRAAPPEEPLRIEDVLDGIVKPEEQLSPEAAKVLREKAWEMYDSAPAQPEKQEPNEEQRRVLRTLVSRDKGERP